jgi:hypothetical protein
VSELQSSKRASIDRHRHDKDVIIAQQREQIGTWQHRCHAIQQKLKNHLQNSKESTTANHEAAANPLSIYDSIGCAAVTVLLIWPNRSRRRKRTIITATTTRAPAVIRAKHQDHDDLGVGDDDDHVGDDGRGCGGEGHGHGAEGKGYPDDFSTGNGMKTD